MFSFVLIFLFAFGATLESAPVANSTIPALPNVAGNWTNELGSKMVIIQNGNTITGRYCTAVSRSPIKSTNYLIGQIGRSIQHNRNVYPIGFTVTYYRKKNNHPISLCTWSGQYRKENDVEKIYTTWLLTSPSILADDMWSSTLTSKDTFIRKDVPSITCSDNES